MRLVIDDTACVSSGMCSALAGTRFTMEAQDAVQGRPTIVQAEVSPDAADGAAILDALACCPAAAISLVDSGETTSARATEHAS